MNENEVKDLLLKNLETNQETLKIVKSINRARKIGAMFTTLKWVLIIGFSLGLYYFIEPFLTKTMTTFDSIQSGLNSVQETGKAISTSDGYLMDKIKGLLQGN